MKKILLLTILLAGCAGQGAIQSGSEVPVSQQVSTGDARTSAKAHTELGLAYFNAGLMGVALEEARMAAAADPSYAPVYNLYGLIYMNLGETAQSQANFERAINLAPGDPEINNNYGLFLCRNGQEKRAIQHFMSAVKNPLYSTPSGSWLNAGLCSLQLKDDAAAEDYFTRAINADGRNGQAIFQLADINYRRGKLYEARRLVDQLHQQMEQPNAASLWLALRIERKLGDRQSEANFSSQLRRKFANSKEHQALMQGKFE